MTATPRRARPTAIAVLAGALCALCALAPAAAAQPDSARTGSLAPRWPSPVAAVPVAAAPAVDTVAPRPRAVEYDEGYARRLTIHRWGSYVMLPLFVAQYLLGDRLIEQKEDVFSGARTEPVDADLRRWHAATAAGVGALFVVNTTTGVWNLLESRHDPSGRGVRTVHAVGMLLADAGFVATGLLGSDATDSGVDDARRHRNVALVSMGIATASAALMWLRKD